MWAGVGAEIHDYGYSILEADINKWHVPLVLDIERGVGVRWTCGARGTSISFAEHACACVPFNLQQQSWVSQECVCWPTPPETKEIPSYGIENISTLQRGSSGRRVSKRHEKSITVKNLFLLNNSEESFSFDWACSG
jgi:hypothetical protein